MHCLNDIGEGSRQLVHLKNFFLHIVMKVALFYTQNRSESSTFLNEKS
jgi:hypothetical protein